MKARGKLAKPALVSISVVAVLALIVAGMYLAFLTPIRHFERTDSEGVKACEALDTALQTKNGRVRLRHLLQSGDHAVLSETSRIVDAAVPDPATGRHLVDWEALRPICNNRGFSIPVYADAHWG